MCDYLCDHILHTYLLPSPSFLLVNESLTSQWSCKRCGTGFIKPTQLASVGERLLQETWKKMPPQASEEYKEWVDKFLKFSEEQPGTHVSKIGEVCCCLSSMPLHFNMIVVVRLLQTFFLPHDVSFFPHSVNRPWLKPCLPPSLCCATVWALIPRPPQLWDSCQRLGGSGSSARACSMLPKNACNPPTHGCVVAVSGTQGPPFHHFLSFPLSFPLFPCSHAPSLPTLDSLDGTIARGGSHT